MASQHTKRTLLAPGTIGALIALVCALSAAAPAHCGTGNKTEPGGLRQADFEVTGAGCVLCIRRLTYVLKHSPGVKEASVTLSKPHKAKVVYDCSKTNLEKIFSQFKQEAILRPVKVSQLKDSPLPNPPQRTKE